MLSFLGVVVVTRFLIIKCLCRDFITRSILSSYYNLCASGLQKQLIKKLLLRKFFVELISDIGREWKSGYLFFQTTFSISIYIFSSSFSKVEADSGSRIVAMRTLSSFFHFSQWNRCFWLILLFLESKSYLQHMTALQDRARSRKYCRTPNVRAYLRVFPSIMRAKSFSL